MSPLLSDNELAAIQSVAQSGMVSSVALYRKAKTQTADGWTEQWPATPSQTVVGWLYETTGPGTAIGVIAGALGVLEQAWLRLPVGTDVQSGDKAVVNGAEYIVEHTNAASTYQPWVSCGVKAVA